MQYVNLIRQYTYHKKLELKDAVEMAVTECIREGILREFLLQNRAEVVAMSIFEFDEEKEWKLIREAEYQYGVESGMETGLKQGRKFYLIQNICKKLRKNKDAETIAMELEEDLSLIQKICDAAKEYSPEYDENEILKTVSF